MRTQRKRNHSQSKRQRNSHHTPSNAVNLLLYAGAPLLQPFSRNGVIQGRELFRIQILNASFIRAALIALRGKSMKPVLDLRRIARRGATTVLSQNLEVRIQSRIQLQQRRRITNRVFTRAQCRLAIDCLGSTRGQRKRRSSEDKHQRNLHNAPNNTLMERYFELSRSPRHAQSFVRTASAPRP